MIKTILRSQAKQKYIALLFLITFILLGYQKLAFYVRFDFNFILLIMVLPFVIRKYSNEKSIRFGIFAVILFLLFFAIKLSSIYFLAFICSLFFLYESQFGKLTSIPLFLIMIVSPVALFLSEIVGFEIRLWLTKAAVTSLNLIQKGYSFEGNIILYKGNEFHVDTECMGLKMVIISMFFALIFITFQQDKRKTTYSFHWIILILLITYVLVIISNFFRIIIITLFALPANTFGHEIAGIISLIVYVLIPLWFLTGKLPSKSVKSIHLENNALNPKLTFLLGISIAILQLIFQFSNTSEKPINKVDFKPSNLDISSFHCSIEEHGVLKYSSDSLLIYVKPAVSFYSADHSPIICWKGSGYKIVQEQIIEINNQQIYFSELLQNNDHLYTTWWYDCGTDKTISQFKWRTQSLLKGNKYLLVNVIANDKTTLVEKTSNLMQTKNTEN